MSKKSASSAKPSESKQSKVVLLVEDDGWGDGLTLSVHLREAEKVPVAKGGYITNYGRAQLSLFGAEMGTEASCCGFPVMHGMYERPMASKHVEEIGEELKKWLVNNVVYMQAYVPSKKGYKVVEKILEIAGFEPTVELTSKHGKYPNIRWEWNRSPNLSKRKNEKAVLSLNV